MNTALFSNVLLDRSLQEHVASGFPIYYDEAVGLFQVNGKHLGFPHHVRTRREAQNYASVHGFKLKD